MASQSNKDKGCRCSWTVPALPDLDSQNLPADLELYSRRYPAEPRLKPVDAKFKQKLTNVIVQANFMSRGIRGQLMQRDACAVPIPVEEITRISLACSIFEANCTNITLRDGHNASVVPVLHATGGSVLERLVQAEVLETRTMKIF